jgi:hypothetical protein
VVSVVVDAVLVLVAGDVAVEVVGDVPAARDTFKGLLRLGEALRVNADIAIAPTTTNRAIGATI